MNEGKELNYVEFLTGLPLAIVFSLIILLLYGVLEKNVVVSTNRLC